MKTKWALILWLFLGFYTEQVVAQTLYLPHYTTKNGLPSNNCFFTLQDQKGYIWVATDAGVSRFDGAVFENFSVDDGLPDNQILQLKEDRKGRVWFLALNGQLSYFYNGKIYNSSNNQQLKALNLNAVVVSFFEDSKGRIWFGTNKNIIACWDGKSVLKYSSPNPQHQFFNTFIHEDNKGNIYAYSTQALHVFIERDFVLIKDAILPLSYRTAINQPNQTMYMLDKDGLNLKTSLLNRKVLSISPALLNNNPGYIYVNDMALWLSNSSGVYRVDFRGRIQQYLNNIEVNQTIEDRDQNMWFTTKNGIYRLPNYRERMYMVNQDDVINSLTKDNRNRLWLGLDEGKIKVLDQDSKELQQLIVHAPEKFRKIKQLKFDSTYQAIYFASDYGLAKISSIDSKQIKINELKETNNSFFAIKNFSIDHKDKLALALSSGVVLIQNRNEKLEFTSLNYKEKEDYFKERSYRVFFDQQQNLWFSNLNGVNEFSNGLLTKYYELHPLLSKRVNDIQQLPDNVFAMATDGYGIVFMQNKKIIKHLTQKDGLNNNIINKLFVKDHYLWAISHTGVNRIAFKQNKLTLTAFDYANDLLSDDLNDLYIDQDTAYFATNNGLIYFAINQSTQQPIVPKVYISSVTHNKESLDLNIKRFIFEPNEHNITFNYSAIDFKNKSITYRYRLRDDMNWTETRNRRLELSSLEPGSYTFEVSARSQDNQWSEPAKLHFELKKYFWQTWWFLSMLAALGAFILYVITVRITRRQKNKEQEKLLIKNKTLMLEQRALQSMMNPHFVFNVMNSIQHYINISNTSSANKVLTGFAKLIRKNLEICTKSYINLEEEIDYLNLYLKLEKNRFGDKLRYNISVDPKIDKEETFIPSMLLQPYIENAIWHGIMPKEDGGEVLIYIELVAANYLNIKITDDGIGIENSLQQTQHSGHQSKGMSLTQERINLLNQIEEKAIQLDVKQNGKSGTTVSILLPLS